MMVRWTLPRFRFDQLMRLAWEGMIPTALLLVLVVSIYMYLDWGDYLWTGSLHYGLIFDKLWRKRNEYTLEEKYKVWLKRHPEASYRVRGDFEQ